MSGTTPVSRWKTVAAFAVIYLVWGSTFLAIRVGVSEVPPFLLAGMRFVVAGILLYGWMRLKGTVSPTVREWGAATIVRGASSRGGTRGGLLAILLVVACVAAGLAFVPVIGYVEAVALAVLGARVRSRTGSRYAGLRILARD